LLVIRRRRPLGEPSVAESDRSHAVLDGTAGAGRIVQAIAALGIAVDTVRQLVVDPDDLPADGPVIDLGDRFDTVVLGSHLVNTPDEAARIVTLELAARQLAPAGRLLVEHHPLDWTTTAAPTPATAGGSPGMVDVRVDPPFVSAVSVYDIGGRVVRQRFRARVVSDGELDAALASAGLVRTARRSDTWIEAATSDHA